MTVKKAAKGFCYRRILSVQEQISISQTRYGMPLFNRINERGTSSLNALRRCKRFTGAEFERCLNLAIKGCSEELRIDLVKSAAPVRAETNLNLLASTNLCLCCTSGFARVVLG